MLPSVQPHLFASNKLKIRAIVPEEYMSTRIFSCAYCREYDRKQNPFFAHVQNWRFATKVAVTFGDEIGDYLLSHACRPNIFL